MGKQSFTIPIKALGYIPEANIFYCNSEEKPEWAKAGGISIQGKTKLVRFKRAPYLIDWQKMKDDLYTYRGIKSKATYLWESDEDDTTEKFHLLFYTP